MSDTREEAPGYTPGSFAIWRDCGGCPERAAAQEAEDARHPEPKQPAVRVSCCLCDGPTSNGWGSICRWCELELTRDEEEALGEAEEVEMAILTGLERL